MRNTTYYTAQWHIRTRNTNIKKTTQNNTHNKQKKIHKIIAKQKTDLGTSGNFWVAHLEDGLEKKNMNMYMWNIWMEVEYTLKNWKL